MTRPILWSFRRCPYAMRARLAIASAGVSVELREIVLRDKPAAFLATSHSGTVPCLDTGKEVIDESLDIMLWALRHADPEGLLAMPEAGFDLIATSDGPFKAALDRYKYAVRFDDVDIGAEQEKAALFLRKLEDRLVGQSWLFGARPSLADLAILPFVRQFAHVDLPWFEAQEWTGVAGWLDRFKTSERFASIMRKCPAWKAGDKPVAFPEG